MFEPQRSAGTYLDLGAGASVRGQRRGLEREERRRLRLRLVHLAVDDAPAWRELHRMLRDAAGCAVLLRTLDDAVDLLLVEVVGDPVTYIVCDHRSTMGAGFGVVVGVAGEGAEALPAEVVVALCACGEGQSLGSRVKVSVGVNGNNLQVMWSQPPSFSMLAPHLGHCCTPISLMAFSDCSSSIFLALLHEPECHGRLQERQSSWSQCGHIALSALSSLAFDLPLPLPSSMSVSCSLPQPSAEKYKPHSELRQAMYDGSVMRRCFVTAVSQLLYVSVLRQKSVERGPTLRREPST